MNGLFDPEIAITQVRREFGEPGGVAPSSERSATFTVMEPGVMPDIFAGRRTPDREGCYLYSRHFNPTVNVLGRYLAAMENTEFAIGTASGMSAIACPILQICGAGKRANRLMDVLQNELHFGLMAVSLDCFDTLMSVSSSSTSSEISDEEQKKMGLSPGLLRISVGISGSLESRLYQIKRDVRKVFFMGNSESTIT